MKTFDDIAFRGTFRPYQQRVLDGVESYVTDRKIHIVAAPGSGKTVLGLELIRFLGQPALVLSPSIVICQHWGERLQEMFLPQESQLKDYVSNNLKKPELITSITYQALHAAHNRLVDKQTVFDNDKASKVIVSDEAPIIPDTAVDLPRFDPLTGEPLSATPRFDPLTGEPLVIKPDTSDINVSETEMLDFSDFDLIAFIRQSGIKTICVDEAHHLKQEWQKALEEFLAKIDHDVHIIALTATPPYDSTPAEWNRYISLCGQIDEEIFIPELVAQGTLCPHQDYIYFNYPTNEESELIGAHWRAASACLEQIVQSGLLQTIINEASVGSGQNISEAQLYEYPQEYLALFAFAKNAGLELAKKPLKELTRGRLLPRFDLEQAHKALNFVITNEQMFTMETVGKVLGICRACHLISRGKLIMDSNEKVNKLLIASLGKLQSIEQIVTQEYGTLQNKLRMLILTDYIRKDCLNLIGTTKKIGIMGTVPIFEAVRRALPRDARVGLISGTLVIWPTDKLDALAQIAQSSSVTLQASPITSTDYSTVNFGGNNRVKVAVITQAFQSGHVQVVVGTKSLLGEGWDSPCINSLIMASFVGSYVLSNQMRGRAIRVVRNDPEKTANIWHLVAVEPVFRANDNLNDKLEKALFENYNTIKSYDYRTLIRRFECFFAPAYSEPVITNGIERVNIIKPLFNREGYENINRQMLERATDRMSMVDSWETSLAGNKYPEIVDVAQIPKTIAPKRFVYQNLLYIMAVLCGYTALLGIYQGILREASRSPSTLSTLFVIIILVIGVALTVGGGFAIRSLLRAISPTRTVKCFALSIQEALEGIGEIKTKGSRVKVVSDEPGSIVVCSLFNAAVREKNVFSQAIAQMFTAIDNPRYLVIKERLWLGMSYNRSFACPSVFSNAKSVEIFGNCLTKHCGNYQLLYTRTQQGFRTLRTCQRFSYINRNELYIKRLLKADC